MYLDDNTIYGLDQIMYRSLSCTLSIGGGGGSKDLDRSDPRRTREYIIRARFFSLELYESIQQIIRAREAARICVW